MDIVERLRICAKFDPDQAEAADKIERLREALNRIQHSPHGTKVYCRDGHEEAVLIARAALGEDK